MKHTGIHLIKDLCNGKIVRPRRGVGGGVVGKGPLGRPEWVTLLIEALFCLKLGDPRVPSPPLRLPRPYGDELPLLQQEVAWT